MSVQKEVSSMEAPCSSGNASEQLLVTDWAQLQSVGCSTGFSSYNVGNSRIQTIERLPSLSCLGSESLSEIMNSFGLPESTLMASAMCAQEFASTIENGTEKNLKMKKRKNLPECGPLHSHSPAVSNQNVEAEQQKDVPTETAKSPMEKDERKQKNEASETKEDYFHVRAKRGQATNSHSLAERVRREKISERMRLLQDLVPGCNKITGKAVMLDEIINYVQSLQRQVEFLSMKLAAVNPELDLDIEQIFTKNLHSRFGSSPALGYRPQIATAQPQLQPGMTIPSLPNARDLFRTASNAHITSVGQMSNPWDNEFQNSIQMGLIPNLPHDGMELNGSMKVEL